MICFDYRFDGRNPAAIADRFGISFRSITRPLLPWKEEIYLEARRIAESTKRPMVVCMSGGIDSEVVARAFHDQGIPFSALSISFSDGTNEHDIGYAKRFCTERGIAHELLEVDPIPYLEDAIRRFCADGYESNGVYRYLVLALMEHVEDSGGCAIIGGGVQGFTTINRRIHMKKNTNLIPPLQWLHRNHAVHYPYFFSDTPELFAAYQEIDLIACMLRNPDYFMTAMPTATSPEKILVLHSLWPDMVVRPKYEGYENINHWRKPMEKKLGALFPHLGSIYIPVQHIRHQLGMDMPVSRMSRLARDGFIDRTSTAA